MRNIQWAWAGQGRILQGVAESPEGKLEITALSPLDTSGDWRLTWHFSTPKGFLLHTHTEVGIESKEAALSRAEEIFTQEISKSQQLKAFRKSSGWNSIH